MKKKILILIHLILITNGGCSTLSNPTLITGAVGLLSCSVVGAVSAPEDEKPEMHSLLWGSSCATVGMALSELILNQKSKSIKQKNLQTSRAKDSLDELKIKNSILNSKGYEELDFETKEKLKGNWSIYKIDNWILDKGKIKHEDMEIEFE